MLLAAPLLQCVRPIAWGATSHREPKDEEPMRKYLLSAVVAVAAFAAAEAQAFPSAPATSSGNADVILVAGGCGPGFHRGPHGGCRPNVGPGPRRCRTVVTPHSTRRVCNW